MGKKELLTKILTFKSLDGPTQISITELVNIIEKIMDKAGMTVEQLLEDESKSP